MCIGILRPLSSGNGAHSALHIMHWFTKVCQRGMSRVLSLGHRSINLRRRVLVIGYEILG